MLQRIARIEGGLVVNVIESETVLPGWVVCGNAGPGWAYNGTSFSPPTAPAQSEITVFAFRDRFTPAEKIAIYEAAKTNVEIQIWLDDLNSLQDRTVVLGDPRTTAGVYGLQSAGLIAQGRAAVILS